MAKPTHAVSRGDGTIPFPSIAARLGFKRGGIVAQPKFEFQTKLKKADAPELMKRRNQMKIASTRVYNQMGWSNRTYETARQAMLSFNQFRETIPDTSMEERDIANRLAIRLGDLVEEFRQIRTDKIALAEELEHALTVTKRDTRLATAKKLADAEAVQRKRGVNSLMPDEANPELAVPSIALDPELILKNAEQEIKLAEQAKHPKKVKGKKTTEEEEGA